MPVFDNHEYLTQEEKRLKEDRNKTKYWKKWGPYVAERQWATGKSSHTTCPMQRWSSCRRGPAMLILSRSN